MFDLIDDGIRAVLRPVLQAKTDLVFGPPDPAWLRLSGQACVLNAFLYRIREDAQARMASWTDVRDERGRVVERRLPVRRFEATYFITAWAADAEREHRLLGTALGAFALRDPAGDFFGPLTEGGQSVSVTTAGSDLEAVPTELWSAAGVPPHSGFPLAVLAPLVAQAITGLPSAPSEVALGVDRGTGSAVAPPSSRLAAPRKRITENP